MASHEHLHRHHARAALPNPDPEARGNPSPNSNPIQTLVSVIYVTASPTFTGPIGGYTTLGPVIFATTSSPDVEPTSTPDVVPSSKAAESSSTPMQALTSSAAQTTLSTSSMPSMIVPSSSPIPSSIPLLTASNSLVASHSSTTSASAESATASSTPSSSGGMSSGAKAGLAIGIVLIIGAVLSVVLFCFKKRKDAAKHDRLEDEKNDIFAAGAAAHRAASTRTARTASTAPRLSLRPVTQFLPNLGNASQNNQNRGQALATLSTPAGRQQGSAWEKPMRGQEQNRNNPFGNHAETIDATNANGPAVIQDMGPGGEIATSAAAVGAVTGLARGASKRGNGPKPLDFTKTAGNFMGPPSPAGTEFSMSSEAAGTPAQTGTGAAIAAAGGPTNSAVHRVQLDFKPSMDDELQLRGGQLIRLLHEYDDGWALCIRLDRSQQGVVPRTCLSTRPVKPRPQQNGPRGPPPSGMRVPQPPPMSPSMNQGPRPMSPAGNRPMTPTGPQYNAQRPATPNGQRSRSPSAAQMQGRRNSPPGPSPMNPIAQTDGTNSPRDPRGPPPAAAGAVGRKPVPGQAM